MEIIKYTGNNSELIRKKTLTVLKNGGIVVFPTETCYGLGVDATDQTAVDKLFLFKTRREGKPLSITVSSMEMAAKYVEINETAANLYQNYLPGPITVISKGLGQVAKNVESEYGTLGIRIPDYPLITEIIKEYGKPMTATSANVSYIPKAYSVEAFLKDTPQKNLDLISLIIDAGELPHRETSTVVDTTMNNLNIMRPGQMKLAEELEGKLSIMSARTATDKQTVDFGGMNMLKYLDEPLDKPLVFFLMGELGAGKTQFSKGIAQKLGIKEMVKSPTFTILNVYNYELGSRHGRFIHIDTWRVDSIQDLTSVGLDQYLVPGNIISIEWADKFLDDLRTKIIQAGGKIINVVFTYLDENTRNLETYE